MDHYHVILEGYPDEDTGYVLTKDGEYLGTWVNDENDIISFIPDGADAPLFTEVFLGPFCQLIKSWHEAENGG